MGPKESEDTNGAIDTRLLSDAIVELNVSRRNVSIYPKDHPTVAKSLNRSFAFLQKIFESRPEITLAVAKDTLLIDDFKVDSRNRAFKEFALHLNRLSIAYITFKKGITEDEIYEFHGITSEKITDTSPDRIQQRFTDHPLAHIKVGFVDYNAFSFEEDRTEPLEKEPLWERYIHALLEGRIAASDVPGPVMRVTPKVLADFFNKLSGGVEENAYEGIISAYIEDRSATGALTLEISKLIEFLKDLKPGLSSRFLSAAGRVLEKDIEDAGRGPSTSFFDDMRDLLIMMEEQHVLVPEILKSLLGKEKLVKDDGLTTVSYEGNPIADDIMLSFDTVRLFDTGHSHVPDAYEKDLQRLMTYDAPSLANLLQGDPEKEYIVDYVENTFYDTVLEIVLSEGTSEDDYRSFMQFLQEQADRLIWTGQYNRIRRTLEGLTMNLEKDVFPDLTEAAIQYFHSLEFLSKLVDSLKIVGRQAREEARFVCERYGEEIIRPMMDALVTEESPTVRKFFLGLLTKLGSKVVPEAITRLGDSRWYVKRNMLYLLSEINSDEAIPHIRPYCRHENRKVSFEALKYLLNAGDAYGADALRDYLRSENRTDVEQAIALVGALRARELIPDLLQLLKKRMVSSADVYYKIPVVKVLGEIGDPGSLKILKEILSSRSIIFKGALDRLKEEIYRSLKNYPVESVSEFIEAGLKSRNDIIRAEASRLSRRGGKRD